MAKLIYELEGVRGRYLKLYDTKVIIITKKTAGSLLTGNFTDGEKTLFLCDVVGVQFKRSGGLIGYLQFETPSMQMNNKDSNMFSENTFTFESGKNGTTNDLVEQVYRYVTDRIEEIKYNTKAVQIIPSAEMAAEKAKIEAAEKIKLEAEEREKRRAELEAKLENANFSVTEKGTIICAQCKYEQPGNRKVCWHCAAKFE